MTYASTMKTCLIGKESAWGTAVSATKDVGIVTDISNNFSREVTETMSMGDIDVQSITSGVVDIGHNISGEFQHGRLLEYAIGAVAHADTSSDTTHTFTSSSTPPSFSMESSENLTTDTVLTSAGLLVESYELSVALNENLKFKCDVKGKTTTSSDSASAAVIDTLPVFPHSLCEVKVNDVEATEVQNASIKITKKVERSGGIGSNLFQQGHGVEMRFEYSMSLGFQDKTFQELWLGGTTPSATSDPTTYNVKLSADNGTALGSGKRAVSLELTSCIGRSFDKVASVSNMIFIDMSGTGKLSACTSVDDIPQATW